MKFGQLINITRVIFLFKNHGKNKVRRLVQDLFLFFQEALYKVKASGVQLSVSIFR